MYYPEEGFEGIPMSYGVENGASDVGGGRAPNVAHGMSHHHGAIYMPQHMMGMTNTAYMPSVPSSHQMHMQGLNVPSHLSSTSAGSLRTSSESASIPYATAPTNTMSHRTPPVFHSSQPQQGQLGFSSSTGSSNGSFLLIVNKKLILYSRQHL